MHRFQKSDTEGPGLRDPTLLILVAMPFTLAWDVVTFPVQALGDYYPYGEKANPRAPESEKRDPDLPQTGQDRAP